MRVNVYNEELTGDVVVVATTADTGKTFYGVRVLLKSAPEIHHTAEDDDRSAVTFWIGSKANADYLADCIQQALVDHMGLR